MEEKTKIVTFFENNYTTNRKGAVRNGQLLPIGSIRMTAYRLETGAVISYCYGSL